MQDMESIRKIPVIPSILKVICKTTGMGFAVVARVTKDRWLACAVRDEINFGLKAGDELDITTTICQEIQQTRRLVAFDSVEDDEGYRHHRMPRLYGLRSYIAVPIILKDGSFFGTLGALDPAPAKVNNEEIIEAFKLYADLIALNLSTVTEREVSEAELQKEREISMFRDKFIAILGHDLNNPLNAVMLSSQIIQTITGDEAIIKLANIINDSSRRMNALIEDILDFAKGQLGDGIKIGRKIDYDVEELLREVITEFKVIYPERSIQTTIDIAGPLNCDGKRIAQLFSNLLGNAYKYGYPDKPVKVNARYADGCFRLSVTNACEQIPLEDIATLFQPFYHGVQSGNKGLGLGLYISHEIAKAHHGTIEVVSDAEETTFTLLLPD